VTLSNRIKEAQTKPAARQTSSRRRPSINEVREKAHRSLIEDLGPSLYDEHVPAADLKRLVYDGLKSALAKEPTPLSAADKSQVIQDVSDDILGYGPIDSYLHDADISEVMVNGPARVYIERNGKLERTTTTFIDEAHLRRTIDKIVGLVGRRIDESTPMVDARLADGSRVNAVIHPLAVGGPFLTIRKFATEPYTIHDLVGFGTLSSQAAQFLEACVAGRLNIVISGGTGTGKTTLLNVLSSFIPTDERIVTIEDAKELQLRQDHVLTMESRPPNIERSGEVTIRDLVRNALRMRPDRIVVGECRGGEALDMLQAMNTGHDGSLTTVHANSPRDSLARLETLVLMAGFDLPVRAIREQMASALDVIVHISRLRDGTRRVSHIASVEGKENDVVTLQDLFLFDHGMGVVNGRHKGHLKSTGIRPKFAERLADMGVRIDPATFTPEPFAGRPGARGSSR
jgi:pilus assembly protein CpaF